MKLPPKKKREYLESSFDPLNPRDIEKLIDTLKEKAPNGFQEARYWFGLFHEASAAISEQQTILELMVHLNTSDKKAEGRLQDFERDVFLKLLKAREELMQVYLHSPWRSAMHSDDH
ncbi:MAG: hypothetical protein K2X39_05475, partial [Silvanigrellaceae bacterium]|nr:hypothetical protein [Silvanigrellaceae bacterium]